MASIKAHYFLRATATSTEATAAINLTELKWITNDGTTSLVVNFEDSVTGAGSTGSKITVKGGETLDINLPVSNLYYYATETTVFRLFGIPRTG